ncbi:MAG: hypothetical protein ABIB12_00925 [Patescibacteria group bacterium]
MNIYPFRKHILLALAVLLGTALFFDRDVGLAMLLAFLLGGITFLVFRRARVEQGLLFLFVGALAFHGAVVLFLHYTGFQPFTGGDYGIYHASAQEVAARLHQGVFSLEGIPLPHYYPVIIGVFYALFTPSMVVGQMFNAWLASFVVVLLYFLARETGASRAWAVVVGLLGMAYPSFVFFGDLLLKEHVVTLLVLAGLLLVLRILKHFSWWKILFLFALAIFMVHFRVYVGLIFIGVFLLSWMLLAQMPLRKRAFLGVFLFVVFGFAPLLAGDGYYGSVFVSRAIDSKVVRYYKEEVFNPEFQSVGPVLETIPAEETYENIIKKWERTPEGQPKYVEGGAAMDLPGDAAVSKSSRNKASVTYLTTGFENPLLFLWNYARSFLLTTFGPFPWHFKTPLHAITLLETVPWWVLAALIGKGIIVKFRRNRRSPEFALALFSFAAFAALAFYFNNFGILMRIREPAFLALLPFLPFAFRGEILYTISRMKMMLKRR